MTVHRFTLLLSLLLLGSCATPAGEPAGDGDLGMATAAIKGGDMESGWLGVGALTADYIGWGYQGSFCSASLIDRQWVLTAAHCLSDDYGNLLAPETTQFYVGPNANPNGFGVQPAEGRLFRANAVYIHPDYNPPSTIHDIGIVHLAEPIDDDVPTYAYNTTTFAGSDFVGRDAFYVGFGVTDGVSNVGAGYKRSADITIHSFYDNYYSSFSADAGVCFGDSGGPGLLEIDGEWRIIGVNSTVSSRSEDPCDGYSNQTRVDTYADWVASFVDEGQPDCRNDASLCWCPEACRALDGSCDNSVCRTLSCRGGAECMRRCESEHHACYTRCALNATEEAEAELREFYLCVVLFCSRQEGDARDLCIEQNCDTAYHACYDIPEGDDDCRATLDCALDCDPADIACEERCYVGGDTEAREAYNAIMDCASEACGERWLRDWDTGEIYDQDAWNACFYESCGESVDACRQPVDCDPLGGSCPEGEACVVTGTGATDCLPALSTGASFGCMPDAEALGCADGLVCVEDESGFLCQQHCLEDADCPTGVACETGIFPGDESVGVCWCRDNDHDGACAIVDCDDAERSTYPDAKERCDDELDNDCDGETDEGCETCEDADNDGYCADVDCNDNNLAIHPGPVDGCGDGIDGNCNGEVDEGCEEQCTDGDGDGYCEEVECDDSDAAVNPIAPELCGDEIDNNCDGLVDEGCPVVGGSGTCAAGGAGGAGPLPLLLLSLLLLVGWRRRSAAFSRAEARGPRFAD